ncbi:MAG TPA: O-antigen ligase family protein [Ignavibacteria bacterium]
MKGNNIFYLIRNEFKSNKIDFIRKSLIFFLSIEVISLSFSIAVSSISFGISFFLWILLIYYIRKWEKTPLDYLFILFIISEIISAIFSEDPSRAITNTKRVFIFSVFYMVFWAFKNYNEIKQFFKIFILFITVLSLFEIIEKFIFHIDRIGIFQHYMTTGGIKMIISLYMLPMIFNKNLNKNERIILILSFIIIFFTLVLTMTRSSWLGFLAGVIFFILFYNKKYVLYFLIILVLFGIFAPTKIKERALSSFDPNHPSNRTRIHMITTGFEIFKDYPIFGIGDIDVKNIYLRYTIPYEKAEGGHLHNNFMQILVCLGLFGLIIFVLIFVFLFIYLFKNYKYVEKNEELKLLSIIPIIVFVAFHVNGLFEWNFGDQEIAILFWFTMGLSQIGKNLLNFNKNMVVK